MDMKGQVPTKVKCYTCQTITFYVNKPLNQCLPLVFLPFLPLLIFRFLCVLIFLTLFFLYVLRFLADFRYLR